MAARLHLSEDQQRFFARWGYLQIPGALAAQTCEDLTALIWRLMPAPLRRDDPASWRGRIADCCNDLHLYQRKGLVRFKDRKFFRGRPEAQSLYASHVEALMGEALGRPVERFSIRGLNPNFPFPRRVSLNGLVGCRLDKDDGPWWPSLPSPPQLPIFGHLETHAVELSAIAYLHDVEEGGGAFAVWPGSHRLMRLAFDASVDFLPNRLYPLLRNQLQRRSPLRLAGRKGDLILFHNRLLHANSLNRSGQVRHAVLLDVLGERWQARQDEPFLTPDDEMARDRLMAAGDLSRDPLVREVAGALDRCRLSGLMIRHPRISNCLQAISKDPIGSARNRLSAKIRSRQHGDHWLVVSQGGDHQDSYKLDAYGRARDGAYRLFLNGRRAAASCCGSLVERLALEPGRHRLRLEGRFGVDHYLRVVSTRRPIHESPVLLDGVISADSAAFEAELVLSYDATSLEMASR
jgi:hypothetical protein